MGKDLGDKARASIVESLDADDQENSRLGNKTTGGLLHVFYTSIP